MRALFTGDHSRNPQLKDTGTTLKFKLQIRPTGVVQTAWDSPVCAKSDMTTLDIDTVRFTLTYTLKATVRIS